MRAAESAAAAVASAEKQYTAELQRLHAQLRHSQAELNAMQQAQQQRVVMCEAGAQASSPAATEASVQTAVPYPDLRAPTPPQPMSALELQQELAKIAITPSRLPPVRRASLGSVQQPGALRVLSIPPPLLPPPAAIGLQQHSPGSAAQSPTGSVYGTPDNTPPMQSVGPTPAEGGLQEPQLPGVQLANILAHPTFEAKAASQDGFLDR